MATWGEILARIQSEALANNGKVDLDGMRRGYLADLAKLTGRSAVVYATDFIGPGGGGGSATQINLGDMQGLMEVFHNLPGPNLDLILHSPGGQAEATERLVRYMRSKFNHVRVFIPLAAMSAATMWAMAADEIVMGKHSQMGPIDPQIGLPTGITLPAGALIQQFQEAVFQCTDNPAKITAWLPILQQYPPGLLNVCESAADLSKKLVADWLKRYMLAGESDSESIAGEVADWLADDKVHLSHNRSITREDLQSRGLKVTDLEDNQELQDAVLTVHHAYMHTFSATPAVKIIENSFGRAFIQQGGQIMMSPPPNPPNPIAPPATPSQ